VETPSVELSIAFMDDLWKMMFGDKLAAFSENKLSSDVIEELIRFVCYGELKKAK
jgi:hypothetical protein